MRRKHHRNQYTQDQPIPSHEALAQAHAQRAVLTRLLIQLEGECNRDSPQDAYSRLAVWVVLAAAEEEVTGGIGAATPAVCEPRPSLCKVTASSLPLGFNPWPAWNFLMASTVESSHLPLGARANDPSFARAC